ncbi:hypothetical protein BV210_00045 [Halorientalis sp. IM1011]|uniref:hypothetical protein n=1 Tax=Halorientalis sp. IM1011 TaxID=1932360 RepID=UPI00097CC725|nr:hypothetical protein BV210_00045 [Halorientalis sp. IM1011]
MSSRRDTADRLRELMETEGDAVAQNTRTVNQLSDYAIQRFDDYEDLRDAARGIKESAIENLPELLDQVTEAGRGKRRQVHVAQTAADREPGSSRGSWPTRRQRNWSRASR